MAEHAPLVTAVEFPWWLFRLAGAPPCCRGTRGKAGGIGEVGWVVLLIVFTVDAVLWVSNTQPMRTIDGRILDCLSMITPILFLVYGPVTRTTAFDSAVAHIPEKYLRRWVNMLYTTVGCLVVFVICYAALALSREWQGLPQHQGIPLAWSGFRIYRLFSATIGQFFQLLVPCLTLFALLIRMAGLQSQIRYVVKSIEQNPDRDVGSSLLTLYDDVRLEDKEVGGLYLSIITFDMSVLALFGWLTAVRPAGTALYTGGELASWVWMASYLTFRVIDVIALLASAARFTTCCRKALRAAALHSRDIPFLRNLRRLQLGYYVKGHLITAVTPVVGLLVMFGLWLASAAWNINHSGNLPPPTSSPLVPRDPNDDPTPFNWGWTGLLGTACTVSFCVILKFVSRTHTNPAWLLGLGPRSRHRLVFCLIQGILIADASMWSYDMFITPKVPYVIVVASALGLMSPMLMLGCMRGVFRHIDTHSQASHTQFTFTWVGAAAMVLTIISSNLSLAADFQNTYSWKEAVDCLGGMPWVVYTYFSHFGLSFIQFFVSLIGMTLFWGDTHQLLQVAKDLGKEWGDPRQVQSLASIDGVSLEPLYEFIADTSMFGQRYSWYMLLTFIVNTPAVFILIYSTLLEDHAFAGPMAALMVWGSFYGVVVLVKLLLILIAAGRLSAAGPRLLRILSRQWFAEKMYHAVAESIDHAGEVLENASPSFRIFSHDFGQEVGVAFKTAVGTFCIFVVNRVLIRAAQHKLL